MLFRSQSLPSDGRLTFRTIDLQEAARLSGIKGADKIGAEQLYLHFAAKQAPKEQFARSEDRKGFLIWQLQRGIAAAGALGLAACVLFAGYRWFEIASIGWQMDGLALETRSAEQEYQRVTATFPVTLTTTENLKATVNEFRSVAARSATPGPSFAYVSRALEQFPQLELDQLVWRTDRAGAPEKKAPVDPSTPVPATAPATPPAAAGGAGATAPSDMVQLMDI